MEDEEITALKNLRQKLLTKACDLVEELKKQEMHQKLVIINEPANVRSTDNTQEKIEHERKLCEISKKVTGITFENIDRKWLKNNLYQYTAFVVTKFLKFYVELLVTLEGEKEFEICGLKCDYVNLNKCYALEIDPWVQHMTEMKNFSLLTSAMIHYTEQSIFRKGIIHQLTVEKYITDELCMDDKGGIIIYVHSPENIQQIYLKVHWAILFFERTWNTEHYFIINPLEAGQKFAKKNAKLLENFCKPNHTKQQLTDQWKRLCYAVDSYEKRNAKETDNSTE